MNYTSIQTAEDFFSSIAKAEQQTTLVNAPTSGSSVFNLSDDGLVSAVALEDVDPDLQSVLDQQYQNLLELTGIASAYIRKKANDKKDPDLIYDYDLWQQVLSNLPLMGPMKSEKSTFHQNIQSVEIATAFLNLILGFAVSSGASVLSNFQNFLQTIGQNITAGKSKGKDMNTVAAVVIQIGITQIGSQINCVSKNCYLTNKGTLESKMIAN